MAYLVSNGHLYAYSYNLRFFKTCLKEVYDNENKQMARQGISKYIELKDLKNILYPLPKTIPSHEENMKVLNEVFN